MFTLTLVLRAKTFFYTFKSNKKHPVFQAEKRVFMHDFLYGIQSFLVITCINRVIAYINQVIVNIMSTITTQNKRKEIKRKYI